MLAKSRNPLNQGTSRNHKPQEKLQSTIKFPPQAERESNASNYSERPRSPTWSVNERKSRGRGTRQGNGWSMRKSIPLHKGKTQRARKSHCGLYYHYHASAHGLLWSARLTAFGLRLKRILKKNQNPSSFFFVGKLLT